VEEAQNDKKRGKHAKEKNDIKTQNKEEKVETKKEHKKLQKILIFIIYILALITFILDIYYIYTKLIPKFKDTQIEIGTKEAITIKDFVTNEKYIENSRIITDMSTIDLNKVGEHNIELMYKQKQYKIKMNLVDTTPPEVKFQDITKYIGYEIKGEDFILEKNDLSTMYVEVEQIPQITEFGKYPVTVIVKDEYGNKTSKECTLTVDWLNYNVTLELGKELTKEHILMRPEEDASLVSKKELEKINKAQVGEYTMTLTNDGKEYIINIKIQDTTPPELELKDVTIYDDEKVEKSKFIVSAKDASGKVETTLLTQIDYKKIGTQVVTIEAKDEARK